MSEGTIVVAKVLGLDYIPSETSFETAVKERRIHGNYIDGARIVAGGNGTYITATQSHLILTIEVDGEEKGVWIERVLKNLLGTKRLTKKLRCKISETMPDHVEVAEREGRYGTEYYALCESTAENWVQRIKNIA